MAHLSPEALSYLAPVVGEIPPQVASDFDDFVDELILGYDLPCNIYASIMEKLAQAYVSGIKSALDVLSESKRVTPL